jgi:hypothetical protein
MGVGCLAGGALLSQMGCTDAIKSCVGQRRRRDLGLPSWDRVKACVSGGRCAVNLALHHSVSDVLAALTGDCRSEVTKCALG